VVEQVYIIDDDPVASAFVAKVASRGGFASTCYLSANQFLAEVHPDFRGCIVLDLCLEDMDGLALQAELLKRNITLPVIILSAKAEVSSAVQAMKQKAFDLFEKPVEPEILLQSIQRAIAHDASEWAYLKEKNRIREHFQTLSERERQVLELVVSGLANKQIAGKLGLSEKTIEVHRGNVMRKMNVDSLASLVRSALCCDVQGLINPPSSRNHPTSGLKRD
jgi:two-component system response regulator FixJ